MLFGDAGGDILASNGSDNSIDYLGDDLLDGGGNDDLLYGDVGGNIDADGEWLRGGDDTLLGGRGDDLLVGDAGGDLLANGPGPYPGADPGSGRVRGGADEMRGEAGDDRLFGDAVGNFTVTGDEVFGEGGADLLDGGGGNDTL